jgi:threonine/homoserine/homoserine lactone efflux protein
MEKGAVTVKGESSKRLFLQGFLTTLLNPKRIVFFNGFSTAVYIN